jgi:Leucine-rich repeat (LRR) protein
MRRAAIFCAVMTAIIHLRCGHLGQIAGGTTTTDNAKVSATIVYPGGKPVSHAFVRLRTAAYLADTASPLQKKLTDHKDLMADDSGRFSIDSLNSGSYFIEAGDTSGMGVLLGFTVGQDSIVALGIHEVRPYGTITGSITGAGQRAYARIRGLERCVRADSTGGFSLQVPADAPYELCLTTSDTTTLLPVPGAAPSQTISMSVDLGNRHRDSLAVRAFLDSMLMSNVPVDSVASRDSSGRIRTLTLSHQNITGLHQSIGALQSIVTLVLTANPIVDLPPALRDMTSLRNLTLDSTALSSLPDGVCQCTRLRLLDLSATRIRDLPPATAGLTDLAALWLNGDSLTAMPEVIPSLTSLNDLGLARNRLTVLPEAIAGLTALQILHLDDNLLTALPDAVTRLPQLKILYVYQNRLSALPDSLGRLSNLSWLIASENSLTVLPRSVGQCSNLVDINLYGNLLDSLPLSIVNLHPVNELQIGGNRLCSVPQEISSWADAYAGPGWKLNQVCK